MSGDRGLRARMQALPLWGRLLVAALMGALLGIPIGLAIWGVTHALIHDSRRSWQDSVLQGTIQCGLYVPFVVLLSSWAGGREASRAALKAIRRNRIPADANPDLLRSGLEGFRRVNQRLRWPVVAVLGLFVAGGVVAAVLTRSPALWLVTGVLLAIVVAHDVLVGSRLGRADALLVELDRHGDGPANL